MNPILTTVESMEHPVVEPMIPPSPQDGEIFQLYPRPECLSRCWPHRPYRPMGVTPETNPDLTRNCPELADPFAVTLLREYAAFLWHWRNPSRLKWIGFTSYRQVEKMQLEFNPDIVHSIEAELNDFDIIAWGYYPHHVSSHSEAMAPGFHKYLYSIGIDVPPEWHSLFGSCLYCNYWIMKWETFNQYMEWSWPLLRDLIERARTDAEIYKPRGPCNLPLFGTIMERLTIIFGIGKKVMGLKVPQ